MKFSEIYIKTAFANMAADYKTTYSSCSKAFLECLNKHGIVTLNPSGDVMVDIDNPNMLIICICEFTSFFEAFTLQKLSEEREFIENAGYNNFKNEIQSIGDSIAAALTEMDGINSQAYFNRRNEYAQFAKGIVFAKDSVKVGYSLPKGIALDTYYERYSAMFTDIIASHTIETTKFTKYGQVITTINNSKLNSNLILDIWIVAGNTSGQIARIVENYTQGKAIEQWKSKGLCPNCGGTFKGLFSKKCSRCGTAK